jgi:hypothetical protein
MGQQFSELSQSHIQFIAEQKIFLSAQQLKLAG